MADRNPVPTIWLMTDERMGSGLWQALRRLPPGAGVVFRHYATPLRERVRMFRGVKRIAQARRLVLVVARGRGMAADGVHGTGFGRGLRTWAAHDRREALRGVRAGADALFVSPVFATRSHEGQAALGVRAAARIGLGLAPATIALGGMDARRWRRVKAAGFDGWAAIDAWIVAADRGQ